MKIFSSSPRVSLMRLVAVFLCAALVLGSIPAAFAADTILYGDIDSDGKVTAADARYVLRASVGFDELTGAQRTAANMIDDGKITVADARYVLMVAVLLKPKITEPVAPVELPAEPCGTYVMRGSLDGSTVRIILRAEDAVGLGAGKLTFIFDHDLLDLIGAAPIRSGDMCAYHPDTDEFAFILLEDVGEAGEDLFELKFKFIGDESTEDVFVSASVDECDGIAMDPGEGVTVKLGEEEPYDPVGAEGVFTMSASFDGTNVWITLGTENAVGLTSGNLTLNVDGSVLEFVECESVDPKNIVCSYEDESGSFGFMLLDSVTEASADLCVLKFRFIGDPSIGETTVSVTVTQSDGVDMGPGDGVTIDLNEVTPYDPGEPVAVELYGDVDFDGDVTVADARFILRAAAGIMSPDAKQFAAGNIIDDGELRASDARAAYMIALLLMTPPTAMLADEEPEASDAVYALSNTVDGDTVTVEVRTVDAAGLMSGMLRLDYDMTKLEFESEDLKKDAKMAAFNEETGELAYFFETQTESSAVLCELTFSLKDTDLTDGTQITAVPQYSEGIVVGAGEGTTVFGGTTIPVDVDPGDVDIFGDVDFDGNVTSADARLILRAAIGLEEFTMAQVVAGDILSDGVIRASDARYALRVAVRLEETPTTPLPIPEIAASSAIYTLSTSVDGDEVTIEVGTDKASGLKAGRLSLDFDKTLLEYESFERIDADITAYNTDTGDLAFAFLDEQTEDSATLCKLTFTLSDPAFSGLITVPVTVYDYDGIEIDPCVSAEIVIDGPEDPSYEEPGSETSEVPTEVPTKPAKDLIYGDADGDGEVTASDARLILRAAAGLGSLEATQFAAADIVGDGELRADDARCALRIAVKLDAAPTSPTAPHEAVYSDAFYTLSAEADGDAVTVRIGTIGAAGLKSGMLTLDYDPDVLEYQTCDLKKDAGMAAFNPENGAFVFYFSDEQQEDTAVLGEITFSLKDPDWTGETAFIAVSEYSDDIIVTSSDQTQLVIGEPAEIVLGDVDSDGQPTSADARLVMRFIVGSEGFSSRQLKAADIVGDGEIRSSDARAILRIATKMAEQPDAPLAPDDPEVSPGTYWLSDTVGEETIDVEIGFADAPGLKSGEAVFTYDKSVFEFVSFARSSDVTAAEYNDETGRIAFVFLEEASDGSVGIGVVTLRPVDPDWTGAISVYLDSSYYEGVTMAAGPAVTTIIIGDPGEEHPGGDEPTSGEVPTEVPTEIPTVKPAPEKPVRTVGTKARAMAGRSVAEILAGDLKDAVLFDAEGNKAAEDAVIASGMKLVTADGAELTVVVKGDNDGDGVVGAADARLALRSAVALESFNDWQTDASLVSGEKEVTPADARLILRAAVNLEDADDWFDFD